MWSRSNQRRLRRHARKSHRGEELPARCPEPVSRRGLLLHSRSLHNHSIARTENPGLTPHVPAERSSRRSGQPFASSGTVP